MIGVYDSGIGGLSVLQALRAEMPGEDVIYLADSGHGPYGERERDHVLRRARRVTAYMFERGVQALVVACNTATAAAIEELRSEHPDLPIIGVEPALKPAVGLSQTRRIGVLATRGTLNSEKFARLLHSLQDQAQFVLQPCDGLALAIENSLNTSASAQADLLECASLHVRALGPIGHGPGEIDTVVLGCTHYPLVAAQLHALIGQGIALVETGAPVARQTRIRLAALGWRESHTQSAAHIELLCTGSVDGLQEAARRWLQADAQAQSIPLN